jgi:phage tail-like protein
MGANSSVLTGRPKPVSGYRYSVAGKYLQGTVAFSKVDGLKDESEIVEYREGTDPNTIAKYPGLSSYDTLTLERGVSTDKSLVQWRQRVSTAAGGASGPQSTGAMPSFGSEDYTDDLTITVYDRGGAAVHTWRVLNAWPHLLEWDSLDAQSSDILLHRLVICHEGLLHE